MSDRLAERLRAELVDLGRVLIVFHLGAHQGDRANHLGRLVRMVRDADEAGLLESGHHLQRLWLAEAQRLPVAGSA